MTEVDLETAPDIWTVILALVKDSPWLAIPIVVISYVALLVGVARMLVRAGRMLIKWRRQRVEVSEVQPPPVKFWKVVGYCVVASLLAFVSIIWYMTSLLAGRFVRAVLRDVLGLQADWGLVGYCGYSLLAVSMSAVAWHRHGSGAWLVVSAWLAVPIVLLGPVLALFMIPGTRWWLAPVLLVHLLGYVVVPMAVATCFLLLDLRPRNFRPNRALS